jgi:hypothetical protein
MRQNKGIGVASAILALVVIMGGSITVHAGTPSSSSIVFTKTVGLDPNECAEKDSLPQVPENGIVYYCYQIEYTGTISASCHTLLDSVLGSVLNNIPGGRCCTSASGTNCDPDVSADAKCEFGTGGICSDPTYPVCAAVTFSGVCCIDEEGTNCPIPHEGCDADADCSVGDYCISQPIVANGQTVTRVITATVPQNGISNTATWEVEAGICCDDTQGTCDGSDNPTPCATNDDCSYGDTCRKEGIGLCCTDESAASCNFEMVCLSGRECEDETFDECVPLDTSATEESSARVGVFDTPAVSAFGLATLILALAGFGLFRIQRHQQPV